jgi:hypothetical protein
LLEQDENKDLVDLPHTGTSNEETSSGRQFVPLMRRNEISLRSLLQVYQEL